MKTTTQRRRRLVHRLAVALAAALLAAPAAQAMPLEPPHDSVGGEQPQVVAEPDGLDWTDAGIGAGAATVATLLAVGAGTLAHRRRLANSHPRVQGTAS
jgi:hypothetical protein